VAQRRYDHERWARQQAREGQRQERADLAAQKAVERERKQEAIEAGRAQAEQHNRSNADKLLRLTSILHRGLDRRAAIDLTRLRRHDRPPPLNLGERGEPKREPEWQDYAPAEPGALSGLFGGRARHERRVTEARAEFGVDAFPFTLQEVSRTWPSPAHRDDLRTGQHPQTAKHEGPGGVGGVERE